MTIASKKTPEEKQTEVLADVTRKHALAIKSQGNAKLAQAEAGLAQMRYSQTFEAARAKYPEAVDALNLRNIEG